MTSVPTHVAVTCCCSVPYSDRMCASEMASSSTSPRSFRACRNFGAGGGGGGGGGGVEGARGLINLGEGFGHFLTH